MGDILNRSSVRLRYWRQWRQSPDVLTFWLLLTGCWWCLRCCPPDSSHSRSQCFCCQTEADWPARSGYQSRRSGQCCPPRRRSCTSPLSSPGGRSATAGRCSPGSLSWLCVFSVFGSRISSGGRRACWLCGGQDTTEDREISSHLSHSTISPTPPPPPAARQTQINIPGLCQTPAVGSQVRVVNGVQWSAVDWSTWGNNHQFLCKYLYGLQWTTTTKISNYFYQQQISAPSLNIKNADHNNF